MVIFRRRTALVMLAVLVMLLVSCSSGSPDRGGGERGALSEAGLRWAGFADVGDLEVVAIRDQAGIDRIVRFVLRGETTAIDKALAAAGLSGPVKSGLAGFLQTPLSGFDLATLKDPRVSADEWTSETGQTVHRYYARGGSLNGKDILHVWAYTT